VSLPAHLVEDDDQFEPVADCNWDSLMAWLACDTQWRVSVGFGGVLWIGHDATACDVIFRRRGFADHLWEDLRVMEEAALPVLNSGDD
jgi:hypothetical protein